MEDVLAVYARPYNVQPRKESLKLLNTRDLSDDAALTNDEGSGRVTTENFDAKKENWIKIGKNKQAVEVKEGQTKKEATEGFIEEKEAERKAEEKGGFDVR